MTAKKQPPSPEIVERDPFAILSLAELFALFDGGDFPRDVMEANKRLLVDILDHKERHHNPKGANGTMTITIQYALGKSGDLSMGAVVTFKGPKKPPSSAAAYLGEEGQLTLYSPMMRQMHRAPRTITPHDPETGEVRDV